MRLLGKVFYNAFVGVLRERWESYFRLGGGGGGGVERVRTALRTALWV